MRGWPPSRWPTCTICGTAHGTGNWLRGGSRRGPARSRSESGASPIRKDVQDFYASTRYTKATGRGVKGVYHINAVDAVTQWQVVGCVGRISESFLLPVLEAMLHQFPFRILGFHSDNGSEYVNYEVAKLLQSLLIDFTRSRANRTQDNALVEGKNGAIIRKHMGYGYIGAEHAERVQNFHTTHLNPYLNFHRPCGFATVSLDARGKRQRQYPREDYATPYEKLKSLAEAAGYLKENLSFARLDPLASRLSDTECAKKMSTARAALLRIVQTESPIPPRFH